MIVRVELVQATMDYTVVNLAEAERVIRALSRRTIEHPRWLGYARFAYDGGKRYGCIRRVDVLRAGVLLDEDEAARDG